MFARVILAAALVGASLGAPALASLGLPVPAASCSLGVAKPWVPFRGAVFGSEAYSNGGACADAVVTIVVRAQRRVLWTDAMPASQLMTFVEAKTPAQMKAALGDWLAQRHLFRSSGDLPEWRRGADSPVVVGEFPFYPEAGVDRDTYMQIRSERQAMFCYVQGMESMACVAIARNGTATKVGAQSFPG